MFLYTFFIRVRVCFALFLLNCWEVIRVCCEFQPQSCQPAHLAALLSLIWFPDLVQGGTWITLVLTVQLFFFLFFANTKWWQHESILFTSNFSTNGFSIYWQSFWWANSLNMAKWWFSVPFINGLSPLKKSFLSSTGEAPLPLVKCQGRCLFLSPESQFSREGVEMWPDPSRGGAHHLPCLPLHLLLFSLWDPSWVQVAHLFRESQSGTCLWDGQWKVRRLVSFNLRAGNACHSDDKRYLRLTLVTSSWISCFLRT